MDRVWIIPVLRNALVIPAGMNACAANMPAFMVSLDGLATELETGIYAQALTII